MNIPRYWAKAERTVQVSKGFYKTLHLVAWKGSEHSLEDAQQKANAALEERIQRKTQGNDLKSYPKGSSPLREAIIEEIRNPEGERIAVITRNAVGCLVINTAKVLFIDLDFAHQTDPSTGLIKRFSGWFQGKKEPKVPSPKTEAGLLLKVQNWQAQNPNWAIRVYRTRRGFRLLVAHDLFDPTSELVQQTMKTLGADGLYQKLCLSQACFRARLTPKPWRIGLQRPDTRHPFSTPQEEASQHAWQTQYNQKIGGFSVCKVLANLGQAAVHQDIAQIMEIHDQYTLGDKPLA
jgi:hypothetical protein